MFLASDLLNLLHLDEVSNNEYQGNSKPVGSPNVFGGQVLAQAINAAYRTITNGRILHSLHSYFLEAGNLTQPINYCVTIMRDGGSFSTRRVTAKQNSKVIFILAASFHKIEDGHEHYIASDSDIKPPEELLSWEDLLEKYGDFIPEYTKAFIKIPRPVIFKPTSFSNPFDKKDLPPYTNVWFKLKGEVASPDIAIKQQVLTYLSDYNILTAVMHRHASKAHWGNTQTASLDHSMWFCRDFDINDWLLYSIDSPSASNARGLCRGNIYSRNGQLVASVAQEGLMRPLNQQK